jgi:putative effector of murein hydrolase
VLLGALHPVLMSGAALWWVMRWAGDALGGARGADWLLWGLAPSVAALGLLLFAQRRALWAHAWRVVGVVGAGAALSLASAALMGAWLGLEGAAAASLLPRAVTTAVAVPLSEGLGGTPGLTVVALMVAGVMGAATGSPLLRALRVGQPWARGVAMGASAHALGTASLLEDDPDAAAFSGVAFALTGALTAALLAVPPFRAWLLAWCGL